ncbi:hypothetical protein BC937DRAFT_91950 [Endogone sp. FLAS-F59071]|nr:hypothetical protein BC937DRAFT_91950 [Endogone sp. FLAS-F59071]|eukprot:RUS15825.1 hypothetical protein BC937DRAFT_91950 [Endogone sp. FLAS-F59071]
MTNFNTICKRDLEERCEDAFPNGGHGYGSFDHGFGAGHGAHGSILSYGPEFGRHESRYGGSHFGYSISGLKKRCGSYGCGSYGCGDYGSYGGYGDGFGGYGCGISYSSSYNIASNNTNQACGSQTYENSDHLSASICKDDDTAYSNSNDNACNANTFNSNNVIA